MQRLEILYQECLGMLYSDSKYHPINKSNMGTIVYDTIEILMTSTTLWHLYDESSKKHAGIGIRSQRPISEIYAFDILSGHRTEDYIQKNFYSSYFKHGNHLIYLVGPDPACSYDLNHDPYFPIKLANLLHGKARICPVSFPRS